MSGFNITIKFPFACLIPILLPSQYPTLILFLISFSASFGQEKLTKENAVSIALENNYGIRIAKNQVKIATHLGVNKTSVHRRCKQYQLQ